jgi:hypothetical protein
MTILAKQDQLIFRFRQTDTLTGVSRTTTKKMAQTLGFTGETQVIHYALQRLAKEVLPSYEADDGELTEAQMTSIRAAEPQGKAKSVKSSLF